MSKGSATSKLGSGEREKPIDLRRIALDNLAEAEKRLNEAHEFVRNSTDDVDEHCTGCDVPLHPHPSYRTKRGPRLYCEICAQRALPTEAEMIAVVAKAFDCIAAFARREGITLEPYNFAEVAGSALSDDVTLQLSHETWQRLAEVWEFLAYRPRVAA